MITIYQIELTDNDIIRANAQGFDAAPTVAAKTRMMMGAGKWKEEYVSLYKATYEVDTDDLNEAFEVTNLWHNEGAMVTRLRSHGSSSSVGDIFVKDGNCYIVDNFGFANVGKYDLGV
jgi:hypothetical protein